MLAATQVDVIDIDASHFDPALALARLRELRDSLGGEEFELALRFAEEAVSQYK